MVCSSQPCVAFGFDEIGFQVLPGPALAPHVIGPMIIIFRATTRENLSIDRTAAAEHAGLRVDYLAVVGVLEGCGFVAPDQIARCHFSKADRHVDIGVGVFGASLEQEHARVWHFRQACRQDTTCRTCPYNNVIITRHSGIQDSCIRYRATV